MLNFNKLVDNRTIALKKFIKSGFKNAMDIGCGTGADSIALSMNGMKVNGYDTSLKMIQKARQNAKDRNLNIKFSNTPVQELAGSDNRKYDIVVSLGNAIANIDRQTLVKIIKKVNKLLLPGGLFLIQLLNYESVRKSNKRIVNITRGNDSIFVRFYDFEKNKLNFNVLRINSRELQDYSIITTGLFEHRKKDLNQLLLKNGFGRVNFYSDLNKSAFNTKSSKDLIILAENKA